MLKNLCIFQKITKNIRYLKKTPSTRGSRGSNLGCFMKKKEIKISKKNPSFDFPKTWLQMLPLVLRNNIFTVT